MSCVVLLIIYISGTSFKYLSLHYISPRMKLNSISYIYISLSSLGLISLFFVLGSLHKKYNYDRRLLSQQTHFNKLQNISPFSTIINNERTALVLANWSVLFSQYPKWLKKFDYTSDDSITKFVWREVSLEDKHYEPDDLVNIDSDYLLVNNPNAKLRRIANNSLHALAEEFYTLFNKKIVIVSAYRSYWYQLWLQKWCSATLCARAWFSEHQLGLTIDIFAATTAGQFLSQQEFQNYYSWLRKNAHRYGRTNSYFKWSTIDGYQSEPWHRRYVGRELATLLYLEQQTLTERYHQQTT